MTVPCINQIANSLWDILQIPLPSNISIPSGTLRSRTLTMHSVLEYIVCILQSIQTEDDNSTF